MFQTGAARALFSVLSISALPVVTVASAFASQSIACGDLVSENYGDRSYHKVKAISEDGLYLLEDGEWYHKSYIRPAVFVGSSDGISVGQKVVSTYQGRTLQKVVRISDDGLFILSDGQIYHKDYIRKLVPKYEELAVGQEVFESWDEKRTQKIKAITEDGYVVLGSGEVRYSGSVKPFETSLEPLEGMKVGMLVTQKYEDTKSIHRVTRISDSERIELDNGTWYSKYDLTPIVGSYKQFHTGMMVVEDKGDDRSILKVVRITADGQFLLSDGNWYYDSYLDPVKTCAPSSPSCNK